MREKYEYKWRVIMIKTKIILVITLVAFVIAGLAAWLVYKYVTAEIAKYRIKTEELQPVVVAASPIGIGSNIKEEQLKVVNISRETVPSGSFSEIRAVAGRTAVRDIDVGEIISESKLLPKDISAVPGVMSYIVPPGHRAVTVAVNEVAGVAGFLNPKNKVDVVLTTVLPGTNEHFSKIVLQNVPVLATGKIIEKKEKEAKEYPTVTLDLTPEDAEKLVLAASKGSLQMLLRNVADTEIVQTRGADIVKVLSGTQYGTARKEVVKKRTKAKEIVPAETKKFHNLEIIRGSARVTERF